MNAKKFYYNCFSWQLPGPRGACAISNFPLPAKVRGKCARSFSRIKVQIGAFCDPVILDPILLGKRWRIAGSARRDPRSRRAVESAGLGLVDRWVLLEKGEMWVAVIWRYLTDAKYF